MEGASHTGKKVAPGWEKLEERLFLFPVFPTLAWTSLEALQIGLLRGKYLTLFFYIFLVSIWGCGRVILQYKAENLEYIHHTW